MNFLQYVEHNKILLSIILRAEYEPTEQIEFFTPNDFSQQLGYIKRQKGYIIPPHVHNELSRDVSLTKEVLFVKSGEVRVDFYSDVDKYLFSDKLKAGDVILLAHGGHGFEVLENAEIIEVKQGPFAGEKDKTRFKTVDTNKLQYLQVYGQ
jgi:hypothetical protein